MENIYQDIKLLSEAFRNVTLAIGAVGGGIWTLRKFNLLNQKKIAKLQVEKLEKELKIQPVLKINILEPQHVKGNIFKLVIKLENTGNDDEFLQFSSPPLSIAKINVVNADYHYSKPTKFDIEFPGKNGNSVVPNTILRKGMSKEYVFLLPILNTGSHFIHFEVPIGNRNNLKYKEYEQPKWTKSEVYLLDIDN
ncbi:hypothetical protein [Flammeovirga sp. OC4]|uniref:hypothetical protein n=1 Tax=Flammeovirga sp. OC4 TaxID=1382345 RepID=UPI0005C7327E|nr:hypothetical protein [Flammeovirga sp. OC4]